MRLILKGQKSEVVASGDTDLKGQKLEISGDWSTLISKLLTLQISVTSGATDLQDSDPRRSVSPLVTLSSSF